MKKKINISARGSAVGHLYTIHTTLGPKPSMREKAGTRAGGIEKRRDWLNRKQKQNHNSISKEQSFTN